MKTEEQREKKRAYDRAHSPVYYRAHLEERRAYARGYHASHLADRAAYHISSTYGMSPDEYALLLADQGGGCAICGSSPNGKALHVDHDHKTGKIRGLLCYRCNRFLVPGLEKLTPDRLARAVAYLEKEGVS